MNSTPHLSTGIDLVQSTDKLFMQCLTAVVTAFAHHLMAAAGGQLNPAVECETEDSEANSQQWLRLVAQRGALVHLQSTMMVQQVNHISCFSITLYHGSCFSNTKVVTNSTSLK